MFILSKWHFLFSCLVLIKIMKEIGKSIYSILVLLWNTIEFILKCSLKSSPSNALKQGQGKKVFQRTHRLGKLNESNNTEDKLSENALSNVPHQCVEGSFESPSSNTVERDHKEKTIQNSEKQTFKDFKCNQKTIQNGFSSSNHQLNAYSPKNATSHDFKSQKVEVCNIKEMSEFLDEQQNFTALTERETNKSLPLCQGRKEDVILNSSINDGNIALSSNSENEEVKQKMLGTMSSGSKFVDRAFRADYITGNDDDQNISQFRNGNTSDSKVSTLLGPFDPLTNSEQGYYILKKVALLTVTAIEREIIDVCSRHYRESTRDELKEIRTKIQNIISLSEPENRILNHLEVIRYGSAMATVFNDVECHIQEYMNNSKFMGRSKYLRKVSRQMSEHRNKLLIAHDVQL